MKAVESEEESGTESEEDSDDPKALYCCDEPYSARRQYVGCDHRKKCAGKNWYHITCLPKEEKAKARAAVAETKAGRIVL